MVSFSTTNAMRIQRVCLFVYFKFKSIKVHFKIIIKIIYLIYTFVFVSSIKIISRIGMASFSDASKLKRPKLFWVMAKPFQGWFLPVCQRNRLTPPSQYQTNMLLTLSRRQVKFCEYNDAWIILNPFWYAFITPPSWRIEVEKLCIEPGSTQPLMERTTN